MPAWDIRRFQEVFVRYRGVLHEAEEDEICFLFLPLGIQPWGYSLFILLFRLNFYKNLDFLDGMTSDVMLMSIIKIEGVICE